MHHLYDLRTLVDVGRLRWRLVIGSAGLAMLVSFIFTYVAYTLSADVGYKVEAESTHFHSQRIYEALAQLKQRPTSSPTQTKILLTELLDKQLEPMPKQFAVRLHLRGASVQYAFEQKKDIFNQFSSEFFRQQGQSGLVQIDGNSFLWEQLKDHQMEVIVVRQVGSLDTALEYVSHRLTITAFVTFWLVIWAALILSAFLTKKVQQTNQRLADIATRDSLTGLYNRTYLLDRFSSQNTPNPNASSAILLLDVDKFKQFNDMLGHVFGDQLLRLIAERIQEEAPEHATVIRLGGDEFVIWVPGFDSLDSRQLASQVVSACEQPLICNDQSFEITATAGIAIAPRHGSQIEDLLKHSEMAMYRAKKLRLGFSMFDKALLAESDQNLMLRGQFHSALDSHQFKLVYQPKVDLRSKEWVGVEALSRWHHPKMGMLTPNLFIELIEQGGFVHRFSRYVISHAVKQIKSWQKQQIHLPVSVNLSPYNLTDPDLVPFVKQTLIDAEVEPEMLELELTESATMVDLRTTVKVFRSLKSIGVKLSIDDFGTGMSSLSYIKQLDVDFVKIDRSFVSQLEYDKRDIMIIESLISLCAGLEKTVVAEGVETPEQAEILRQLGCPVIQGFLFGKPVSAHELAIKLASGVPDRESTLVSEKLIKE